MPDRFALDFDRLGALVEPAACAGRARISVISSSSSLLEFSSLACHKLFQKRHQADESPAAAAAVKDFLLSFFVCLPKGLSMSTPCSSSSLASKRCSARSISEPFTDEPGEMPLKTSAERLARIGKNQFGIEIPGEAHAGALAAGALLAVERKKPRIERLVADAAAETEKSLIENLLAALGNQMDHAVAQTQSLIDHRFDLAAAGFGSCR